MNDARSPLVTREFTSAKVRTLYVLDMIDVGYEIVAEGERQTWYGARRYTVTMQRTRLSLGLADLASRTLPAVRYDELNADVSAALAQHGTTTRRLLLGDEYRCTHTGTDSCKECGR